MTNTQAVKATAMATPRNVRSSYPLVTSTPTSKTRTYSGTRRSGSLFFSIGTISNWRICCHEPIRFFSYEILPNIVKGEICEVWVLPKFVQNKTQNATLIFLVDLRQL